MGEGQKEEGICVVKPKAWHIISTDKLLLLPSGPCTLAKAGDKMGTGKRSNPRHPVELVHERNSVHTRGRQASWQRPVAWSSSSCQPEQQTLTRSIMACLRLSRGSGAGGCTWSGCFGRRSVLSSSNCFRRLMCLYHQGLSQQDPKLPGGLGRALRALRFFAGGRRPFGNPFSLYLYLQVLSHFLLLIFAWFPGLSLLALCVLFS